MGTPWWQASPMHRQVGNVLAVRGGYQCLKHGLLLKLANAQKNAFWVNFSGAYGHLVILAVSCAVECSLLAQVRWPGDIMPAIGNA